MSVCFEKVFSYKRLLNRLQLQLFLLVITWLVLHYCCHYLDKINNRLTWLFTWWLSFFVYMFLKVFFIFSEIFFSSVFHEIDLTKTIYHVWVAQSLFPVLPSMIMMVKVGGDLVDFKVVESLLVFSLCIVTCLSVCWFLKSKLSLSKKEILIFNSIYKFEFLKFANILSVCCL